MKLMLPVTQHEGVISNKLVISMEGYLFLQKICKESAKKNRV